MTLCAKPGLRLAVVGPRSPPDVVGMRGFSRADGRVGIRDYILVAYLVECAHHVARRIVDPYAEQGVQLIGFPGCYPSGYAHRVLEAMCTHPNAGAVLLVSLGCEEFRRSALLKTIRASGRPVEMLVIQGCGGTAPTIERGRRWVEERLAERTPPDRLIGLSDLVIGTKCGGSDGLSGVTINPAVGNAFDRLVDAGATVMFEETCELIGCEEHMASRATDPALGAEIRDAVRKAERYYRDLGHGSFGGGNIKYGLSTLEEKSLGAYAKSGTRPIAGVPQAGRPPSPPRPLPHGHRQRRRSPIRHPEHQRHPDGDRDGGLRLPPRRVHDRRRLGGRAGRRAPDQGGFQHTRLRTHGRRHGRERGGRSPTGWRPSSRSASGFSTRSSRPRPDGRPARRRSATRSSSSATRPMNRSGPPACPRDAGNRAERIGNGATHPAPAVTNEHQ